MGRTAGAAWLAVCLILLSARSADAQSAENVAVVINDASSVSQRIGQYYMLKRAIPPDNIIRLRTTVDETIDRSGFERTIEQPLAAALARRGLQDRILYIVLTKGVPIRITGTAGAEGTVSSVDSELTLLYRRMTGRAVTVRGDVANPYYLDTRPIRDARPFTHRDQDIYLVARLDAFTIEEALALIDRGQKPSREGRIVLDQRAGLSDYTGDGWLAEAAHRLEDLGHGGRVVLEETPRGAHDIDGALGYYSWGSTDPSNRVRRLDIRFVPGALAATFVSTDARTFQNPPDNWIPTGDGNDRKTWFNGSPQTLIGDLIRDGATGVAGHVAEQDLRGSIRPEILFPAYLAGFNLIESFYLALPHLSWQTVIIGDPLCAPFRRKVLSRGDVEEPVSSETEMPGLFEQRRLQIARGAIGAREAPPKALSLTLLAETRLARGDTAGATKALQEATELAPALISAHMQLAMLYDQARQPANAIELYRRIVAQQPNNAVALNNLAYALGVQQKALTEALPLARRAVALAPNDPTVLDTLAWIHHLMGNNLEAGKLLTTAIARGTANATILLHAATVFAANGAIAAASYQLKQALAIDPALEKSDDVRQLRQRLKTPKR